MTGSRRARVRTRFDFAYEVAGIRPSSVPSSARQAQGQQPALHDLQGSSERVCPSSTNRRMRTRLYGGVGFLLPTNIQSFAAIFRFIVSQS